MSGGSPDRRASWPQQPEVTRHDELQLENTLRSIAFGHIGTKYNISDEELRILQDRTICRESHPWRRPPTSISLDQAHEQLERFAHSGWSLPLRQARQRLWTAYELPWHEVHPDLFIKIFNDLDAVLFDGVLHRRVLVDWACFNDYQDIRRKRADGLTARRYRCTRYRQRPHVALHLCAFPERDRVERWSCLIHEMLHAYVMVCTGGKDLETSTSVLPPHSGDSPSSKSHGPLFQRACHILSWRLGFPELASGDLMRYGHSLERIPTGVTIEDEEDLKFQRVADWVRSLKTLEEAKSNTSVGARCPEQQTTSLRKRPMPGS